MHGTININFLMNVETKQLFRLCKEERGRVCRCEFAHKLDSLKYNISVC